MLFAVFGMGLMEMAVLGACCVVPFVVGVITFFLMFRGGTHGENDDANYGRRPPAEEQGADAGSVTEDPQ
jgi:hypothetical protein